MQGTFSSRLARGEILIALAREGERFMPFRHAKSKLKIIFTNASTLENESDFTDLQRNVTVNKFFGKVSSDFIKYIMLEKLYELSLMMNKWTKAALHSR